MKFSLEWHKKNLINMKNSLEREQRVLEVVQHKIKYLENTIKFSQLQLDAAEKSGKTGFDPDRFMSKHYDQETSTKKL